MSKSLLAAFVASGICLGCATALAATPNVVVILADDFGYGDLAVQNPGSRLATPHLDQLATEGVRFIDAHSPSAVCTPTRYGLLTGRYCWRTRLKRGVLFPPRDKPLIDPDRLTLAGLLAERGYRTACVGKWHLGIEWGRDAAGAVDFDKPMAYGPTEVGFNEFFGIAGSLDMVPYAFYDGHSPVGRITLRQQRQGFPRSVRAGPRAEDFEIGQVLDQVTERAVGFIEKQSATPSPFFLYLPLTSPHKPVWPAERFVGTTGLGEYGDFIAQTDWSVGQVLAALERQGVAEDTLVVFSSDNGSFMRRRNKGRDHLDDPTIDAYNEKNHRPNGPYRGTKADIWEAGHHVPLLVRWPQGIAAGRVVKPTVCLTDVFATVAELVGTELPSDAGEDSYSFLPLLTGGADDHGRPPVIHHSINGMFAVRDGKWKLVLGNGSGGRAKPKGEPFGKPYQLYDMEADPSETTDLASQYPEVVERLTETVERIRREPRSIPAPQAAI